MSGIKIGLCLIFAFIFSGRALTENYLRVVSNIGLWDITLSSELRISMLKHSLDILYIFDSLDGKKQDINSEYNCDALSSLILADYYRRENNWESYAYWLHSGITQSKTITSANELPRIQFPSGGTLMSDGDINLGQFWNGWSLFKDVPYDNGWNIVFENQSNQRDSEQYLIYWKAIGNPILWSGIRLRIELGLDTYLAVDVASPDGVIRVVDYFKSKGGYYEFDIPLDRDSKWIYFTIGEPNTPYSTSGEFRAFFKSIVPIYSFNGCK